MLIFFYVYILLLILVSSLFTNFIYLLYMYIYIYMCVCGAAVSVTTQRLYNSLNPMSETQLLFSVSINQQSALIQLYPLIWTVLHTWYHLWRNFTPFFRFPFLITFPLSFNAWYRCICIYICYCKCAFECIYVHILTLQLNIGENTIGIVIVIVAVIVVVVVVIVIWWRGFCLQNLLNLSETYGNHMFYVYVCIWKKSK